MQNEADGHNSLFGLEDRRWRSAATGEQNGSFVKAQVDMREGDKLSSKLNLIYLICE